MLKAIQIELLKSKRTKSFIIATLIVTMGLLWKIAAFLGHINGVEVFFDNQDIHVFVLPIAISIFISRIISNEKEGRTFKLQASNGRGITEIFHQKLYFSIVFFGLMALLYTAGISLYLILAEGQEVPIYIFGIQVLSLLLVSFVQICIYMTLAMILEKQGLVLAMGFIGAFLGFIFQGRTSQFWTFLIPWDGTGFLSIYKFGYDVETNTIFHTPENHLALRICIYAVYALIWYGIASHNITSKGEVS